MHINVQKVFYANEQSIVLEEDEERSTLTTVSPALASLPREPKYLVPSARGFPRASGEGHALLYAGLYPEGVWATSMSRGSPIASYAFTRFTYDC